jgi:hypothetical protein
MSINCAGLMLTLMPTTPLTPLQFMGIVFALVGVIWYSMIKLRKQQAQPLAEATPPRSPSLTKPTKV